MRAHPAADGSVDGRIAETLRDGNGNRVGGLVFNLIFSVLAATVRQFQAIQHKDGTITPREAIPTKKFDEVAQAHVAPTSPSNLPKVDVKIEVVTGLEPSRSGKRQVVIVEKCIVLLFLAFASRVPTAARVQAESRGGDRARIVRSRSAPIWCVSRAAAVQFTLDEKGTLAIAPLPWDAPSNEYVIDSRRRRAGANRGRNRGRARGGKVTKVIVDQESKGIADAAEPGRGGARARKAGRAGAQHRAPGPPAKLRRREVSPLLEVALLFLRLNLTAFGGPAAHIAMMEDEVVAGASGSRAEAVPRSARRDQPDPRPQLDRNGHPPRLRRAGWAGLIVAGVCFILPAMLIVSGHRLGLRALRRGCRKSKACSTG